MHRPTSVWFSKTHNSLVKQVCLFLHMASVVEYYLTAGDEPMCCQNATISIYYYFSGSGLACINHGICQGVIRHSSRLSLSCWRVNDWDKVLRLKLESIFTDHFQSSFKLTLCSSETSAEGKKLGRWRLCYLWAELPVEGRGDPRARSGCLLRVDTCCVRRRLPSDPTHTLQSERQKWHSGEVVISWRPERE